VAGKYKKGLNLKTYVSGAALFRFYNDIKKAKKLTAMTRRVTTKDENIMKRFVTS